MTGELSETDCALSYTSLLSQLSHECAGRFLHTGSPSNCLFFVQVGRYVAMGAPKHARMVTPAQKMRTVPRKTIPLYLSRQALQTISPSC